VSEVGLLPLGFALDLELRLDAAEFLTLQETEGGGFR
jgi:hypothetical protein